MSRGHAQLRFGNADCATCGWKMQGTGFGKNAMAVAANHAKATGHVATAVLEYAVYPPGTEAQTHDQR